ncbi:DUF3558 family protein [Corynebacterium epidermidicanis]|uniref:DUF3558 family protein n=1 Tax=Corynebacterium epidermidicanis TaxID=1050174 RepID=A0A0G3GV56_9CORY|nr:DUF3558 family protein [Corynebacterium epidermidicanis]AKK02712.1 hypothetical protein CEPID_04195 [Corynebacterium epidermidicanis]
MRRRSSFWVQVTSGAIMVTACSVILAGCRLEESLSEVGTPPSTEAAATAGLPTVDLSTAASFDPKAPGFRIVDPCSEIPEDVLREAGLGKRSEITHEPGALHRFCAFSVDSGERFPDGANLAVNIGTRQRAESVGEPVKLPLITEIPNAYQFRMAKGDKAQCSSVAQTSGGQFSAGFIDRNKRMTEQEVCDRSLALLEKLYPIVEGIARNGSSRNQQRSIS